MFKFELLPVTAVAGSDALPVTARFVVVLLMATWLVAVRLAMVVSAVLLMLLMVPLIEVEVMLPPLMTGLVMVVLASGDSLGIKTAGR